MVMEISVKNLQLGSISFRHSRWVFGHLFLWKIRRVFLTACSSLIISKKSCFTCPSFKVLQSSRLLQYQQQITSAAMKYYFIIVKCNLS